MLKVVHIYYDKGSFKNMLGFLDIYNIEKKIIGFLMDHDHPMEVLGGEYGLNAGNDTVMTQIVFPPITSTSTDNLEISSKSLRWRTLSGTYLEIFTDRAGMVNQVIIDIILSDWWLIDTILQKFSTCSLWYDESKKQVIVKWNCNQDDALSFLNYIDALHFGGPIIGIERIADNITIETILKD